MKKLGLHVGVGFGVILVMLLFMGISLGVFAGTAWLICWAFSLTFNWKIVIGCWLVFLLLKSIFSVTVNNNTKK